MRPVIAFTVSVCQEARVAAALILMLALPRGVVLTLLAAGATGTLIALAGGPLPH